MNDGGCRKIRLSVVSNLIYYLMCIISIKELDY